MDCPTDTNSQKKDPFENLSKEELVKKCKTLLSIAQKAKQVKDDIAEENKTIAKKLLKIEAKSKSDIQTMQEMLDALTQQKLQMVIENDTLKKQVHSLEDRLKNSERDLYEVNSQTQVLDTENQGLGRQVKRLSDENDQLITHLDILEKQINELNKIGEQQREQLLSLEKQSTNIGEVEMSNKNVAIEELKVLEENCLKLSNELEEFKSKEKTNTNSECKLNDLKNNYKLQETEISHLTAEILALNRTVHDLRSEICAKENTINSLEKNLLDSNNLLQNTISEVSETNTVVQDLTSELENMKVLKEKYNDKLKNYHSKLVKVFADIKELKHCKCKLLLVIQEYSKHINRWQNEIVEVSQRFTQEITHCKSQLEEMILENSELKKIKDQLSTEKNALEQEVFKLQSHLADKTNCDNNVITVTEANNEHLHTKIDELTKELEINKEKIIEVVQDNERLVQYHKKELEQLEKVIKETDDKLEKQIDISKLLQIIEDNKDKMEEAKANIIIKEELEKEKVRLLEIIDKNNTEIEELEISRDMLEKEKNQQQEAIENYMIESKKLKEIKIKKNKLEIEINKLHETAYKNEPKLKKLEDILIKKNEIEMENSNLLELVEKFKAEVELLIDNKSKNEELENENNKLKEIIKCCNKELENEKFKLTDVVKNCRIHLEELNEIRLKIFEEKEKNNKLEEEIENGESELQKMKPLVIQNEELEREKKIFQKVIEDLKTELEEIGGIQIMIDQLEKGQIQKNKAQLEEAKAAKIVKDTLEKERNDLLKSIDEFKKENTETKAIREELEKEKNSLIKSLETTEARQNEYKEMINKLRDKNGKENSDSEKLIENIQNENVKLRESTDDLNDRLTELRNEIATYKRDCSDLLNQLALSKRENVELLKEMNDMNQALKERGETISKQQEYTQELLRKLQFSEQELAQNKHQSEKLEKELKISEAFKQEQDLSMKNQQQEIIKDRDERIKNLEAEMQQLRDMLQNTSRDMHDGCGDSEVMSTSTISRLEESARLRDLEGSWEERYTKLRTLALKLKGRVKELSEQLSQERTEKAESKNKSGATWHNLQNIQTQYDKLQDEFEAITAENKKYVKNIDSLMTEKDNLNHELNSNLENVAKLHNELEVFRKSKEGGDSAIKQFTSQIQSLKKEVEEGLKAKKELETQIDKIKMELNVKEEELQKAIKSHSETKDLLQKSNKECKKKSVLSLEMEHYERTLNETVQKLEKKNEAITELGNKLDQQENVMASMKEQNCILENRIIEEEATSKESAMKMLEVRKQLSEAEAVISQKENRIRETIRSLENMKTSSEDINAQMTLVVTQSQKQIETLRSEKEILKSQVFGLEEKTKELTSTVKEQEDELHQIHTEYKNYKVRAQSVLKQNKTRDIGLEERLTEEVTSLHSQIENLTSQLESSNSKLETLTLEQETITNEKKKLHTQFKELEILLIKEKQDNKVLEERKQQIIDEHRETLRVQKIHADTLTQCYKQQLAEEQERHAKEISELKSQNQIIQEEALDIEFMKREDGEGSESTESISNNITKNVPLSLDKLLSMDADLSTTEIEAELASCKQQLVQFETKVAHLTDLLADAEQDLAKHAQLNQMLKEEIRRQQRSVEREKHAENLEYLKNVVFKFITLQSSDEKCRLVPVLTTILKLSPAETQKLNTVAKGADPTGRGWGSYLPMWPGANNQH